MVGHEISATMAASRKPDSAGFSKARAQVGVSNRRVSSQIAKRTSRVV